MSQSQPTVFVVQPGAYLFQGPTVLCADVSKDLIVVFAAPQDRVCAVVLSDGDSSPRVLEEMLDNGFQCLVDKLREESAIQCKIFGAGYGNLQPLHTAVAWLQNHGLSIVAKDVGRSVSRKITVYCETGRVGVQYGGAPQESLAELIPRGTARSRYRVPSQNEALILTSSPVRGQLVRQAVEENPSWRATVPTQPLLWLKKNIDKTFRWNLVIFVEDWCAEETASWVDRIREARPSIGFLWTGAANAELNLRHPDIPQVPSPGPENPKPFKQELGRILASPPETVRSNRLNP